MPLLADIADLIRNQGAIAARGQERSGDIWAQAINNIGQIASRVPEQMQQQKAQQQEQQMNALKLQQAQQTANDMKALDAAFAQPGGRDKIIESLPGHLRPAVTKQFNEFDEAHAKAQEAQEKASVAQADAFGRAGVIVREHKYDPIAFQGVISDLKQKYANDPQTLAQVKKLEAAAQGNPSPEFIQSIVDPVIAGSPEQRKLDAEAKTAQARQTTAQTGVNRLGLETPKIQAETTTAQQRASGTLPIQPAEQAEMAQRAPLVTAQTAEATARLPLMSAQATKAIADARKAGSDSSLVRVEHKDPATGRTVIEWIPKGQLAGKTFEKGTAASVENRLASAQAVNQTGDDIIAQLSDPAIAAKLGPAMGRVNSLREFIGNPPPELSELAGSIESYALANMSVHGMRNAQAAQKIADMLDKKHTPESLISTIRGLNKFSSHLMENEGRAAPTSTPKKNPFRE